MATIYRCVENFRQLEILNATYLLVRGVCPHIGATLGRLAYIGARDLDTELGLELADVDERHDKRVVGRVRKSGKES